MRKKDDKKQDSIKEAVINLILKEGFHGTSISKIAKEAGVSPATVYIYYENKEVMLQEIYREYYEEILNHLLNKTSKELTGKELIKVLVENYYNYINENKEIFMFVDQFSSCPALVNSCESRDKLKALNNLLNEMKAAKIIKPYHNDTLIAVIFSSVKTIAVNQCLSENDKLNLLDEIILLLQEALLI